MSPRTAVLVVVGALVLAALAWMLWAPSPEETSSSSEDAATPEAAADVLGEDIPTSPALLYFPDEGGWLQGVEFEAPAGDEEARIRALVHALLAGPAEVGVLAPPLPAGVRLDGLYFLDETSVALDLRLAPTNPAPANPVPSDPASSSDPASAEAETTEAQADDAEAELAETVEAEVAGAATAASYFRRFGSKQELLAVYSLVNTVAMGSERVDRVVLMLDGKQPDTLAGHVDLTRPLRADPSWIRP